MLQNEVENRPTPSIPGWAMPPGLLDSPLPRRTLHLCRTATDACMGAVGQENPGLAVAVIETDGILMARWGEATVFGPVVRSASAPDRGMVEGLVIDTLEAGEKDVFFSCVDEAIREGIADRAVNLGHRLRQPETATRSSIAAPFSIFATRRVRAKAGASGGVMSFCELDPDEHAPLEVGDFIRMAVEATDDGGTEIAYVDDGNWFVGMHGRVPFVLDQEAIDRIEEVSVQITYVSWGRSWRASRLRAMQFLIFEIPSDIDALLADAKLSGKQGGGHL